MTIRGRECHLEEVTLSAHHHEEDGDHFLTLDLLADSDELKRPGFAINCIVLRGVSSLDQVQGLTVCLGQGTDDDLNELAESVICEPGRALEIDSLVLRFGKEADAYIDIQLEAVCSRVNEDTFDVEESGIRIDGRLSARITS